MIVVYGDFVSLSLTLCMEDVLYSWSFLAIMSSEVQTRLSCSQDVLCGAFVEADQMSGVSVGRRVADKQISLLT